MHPRRRPSDLACGVLLDPVLALAQGVEDRAFGARHGSGPGRNARQVPHTCWRPSYASPLRNANHSVIPRADGFLRSLTQKASGAYGCRQYQICVAVAHGNVALIMAPLGHAALHLNLEPSFTIADVFHNLHRLDGSLFEGYMSRHASGMHLLAGANDPTAVQASPADFARLFDLLVNHYKYVVVDASSRLDPLTRIVSDSSDSVLLVAQTDVPSLWSAARVQQYLCENGNRGRLRLVLNRYRKISGFGECGC